MQNQSTNQNADVRRAACLLGFLLLTILPASGQLAITEVMSSATTNLGAAYVPRHPDFWELTNFGTNTIPLDEYRFADDRGVGIIDNNVTLFSGKQIGPGESMVLVKTVAGVVGTPAQFRAWWGVANLPTNLQIYFYSNPGFNSAAESVQLFHVTATTTTLVDRVDFFEAREGSTFTYDPANGEFGVFSLAGRLGAFKAVETDDIGSPGFTTGPVPPIITMQPQNLVVDAGAPATLSVQAQGVPRPLRFEWFKNGGPISNATDATLLLVQAVPSDAGTYKVEVDSGVGAVLSSNATLVVNTNPECARIVVPPADLSVTFDNNFRQTAIFSPSVRGYPLPAIQWQFNGTNLPNATNATLYVVNATSNSTGAYTIRATNTLCTNTATAHLTVTPKPLLQVTEAMSHPSINTIVLGHDDWWELTNFDTNAVNLRGCRFNDLPGPSFGGAFVVANNVMIQPGESIIFARGMSPETFKDWWGEENLPENIQIITYNGHNFDEGGDAIFLWNGAAIDTSDYISSVNFVNYATGVTLEFFRDDPDCLRYGCESVFGQRGAIRAMEADDIGSPGWTTNHPLGTHMPRFTSLLRSTSGASLTWKARAGKHYELQFKSALTNATWTPLSQHSATGLSLTTLDASATNATARFYRLQVLPDSP